ncbi:PadR family transcriptional regulator [Prauserella cavernicola]|uniref:PadR family transcriptional regulator n=1 Tax=Prauserella cavernicola TaxID=2800127 RepID=A0A934V9U3_9PSEU|nr:PadR family transcriptional regulator [Prauserella cavernicola]MBK1789208.1 PadR family transcriptional regulator [Prauserella cavernicola]
MKFLILGLLLAEPLSLYDVHSRFASGLRHIYSASYGSIHRALRQLHDTGHVELLASAATARNTKRYAITEQGTAAWREWMLRPAPAEDSEASMLARVLLLGRLERAEDRRAVLLALRARALGDLEDLRSVQAGAQGAGPESRYPRATADYGVRSAEQVVSWLDELLRDVTPGGQR